MVDLTRRSWRYVVVPWIFTTCDRCFDGQNKWHKMTVEWRLVVVDPSLDMPSVTHQRSLAHVASPGPSTEAERKMLTRVNNTQVLRSVLTKKYEVVWQKMESRYVTKIWSRTRWPNFDEEDSTQFSLTGWDDLVLQFLYDLLKPFLLQESVIV